jgi:hypothetical protein
MILVIQFPIHLTMVTLFFFNSKQRIWFRCFGLKNKEQLKYLFDIVYINEKVTE